MSQVNPAAAGVTADGAAVSPQGGPQAAPGDLFALLLALVAGQPPAAAPAGVAEVEPTAAGEQPAPAAVAPLQGAVAVVPGAPVPAPAPEGAAPPPAAEGVALASAPATVGATAVAAAPADGETVPAAAPAPVPVLSVAPAPEPTAPPPLPRADAPSRDASAVPAAPPPTVDVPAAVAELAPPADAPDATAPAAPLDEAPADARPAAAAGAGETPPDQADADSRSGSPALPGDEPAPAAPARADSAPQRADVPVAAPRGPAQPAPSAAREPASPVVLERAVAELSPRIRAAAHDGGGTVQLELHPRSLGTLRVEVTVRDGSVHGLVVAETPEAAQALAQSLPELRRSLEAQGLEVAALDVGAGGGAPADERRTGERAPSSGGREAAPGSPDAREASDERDPRTSRLDGSAAVDVFA